MKFKRIYFAVPITLILLIAAFAIAPGSQSSITPSANGLNPSLTPNITLTPVPSPTPTVTDPPMPTATVLPTLTPLPPTRTPLPTATRDPNLRVARVPILMYHYISVPPPDADKYRLDLSVTPANFQAQMDYLASAGYHPIRVMDLTDHLLTGAPLPSKPIVLTFDDGYLDNYQNVFPILKQYHFPATFFVITNWVDEQRAGYMTWAQLGELSQAGMEIGSHTGDHVDLRNKPRAYLNTELAGSKVMIEARLGITVKSFCYPSGKYDAHTIDALKSIGYLAATTEITGMRQASDAMYELRRIRVRGSYTVADFASWLKYYADSGK